METTERQGSTALVKEAERLVEAGDLDGAASLLDEERRRLGEEGDTLHRGLAAFAVSSIHQVRGDLDATTDALDDAIAAFEEARRSDYLVSVVRKLVEILVSARSFERAEPYAERYFELALAMDRADLLFHATSLVHMVKASLGKRREGLEYYGRAKTAPSFTKDPRFIQNLAYLTRTRNPLSPSFREQVLRAKNRRLLGYLYQERGADHLAKTNLSSAVGSFERSKKVAIEERDIVLYFQAMVGLVIAYQLSDKKLKCLDALLVGGATLKALLGEEVVPAITQLYDVLELLWGPDMMTHLVQKFEEKYGIGDEEP